MQVLKTPTVAEMDYYDILGTRYFGEGTLVMKAWQYRWLIENWADLIKRDIENSWDINTFIERNRLKLKLTKPPEVLL